LKRLSDVLEIKLSNGFSHFGISSEEELELLLSDAMGFEKMVSTGSSVKTNVLQ
jgi:hypothetical protein